MAPERKGGFVKRRWKKTVTENFNAPGADMPPKKTLKRQIALEPNVEDIADN